MNQQSQKASYLATYLDWIGEHLSSPTAIEVAINSNGEIWVENAGSANMVKSDHSLDPQKVADLAGIIANTSKNKLTDASPIVSAAVEYKGLVLRAQIVAPPAVARGTVLSFRVFRHGEAREPKKFKFLRDPNSSLEDERLDKIKAIRDLAAMGQEDEFLRALISNRLNIVVSGGTSTGKTELGRRMLWMVDDVERIVTIEDSLELLPRQDNVVSLIATRDDQSARSANRLLQATLRMRPDRIILGELRGVEAATFLDAINTGHAGSFTTLHAESARKAMDRLALLVMSTGTKLSYPEVIRYLEGSIDVIIQTGRLGDERGLMEVYFPALKNAEAGNQE
ncbi:ATPase, T2SS/T4P/T4SS family [uncultured Tateyamaria sp.]|uniref:ATPase, T2SS/T4P/T4SS family n=1 Tax=uncultured Tateyamaria sp. TaxID=455651 RepID=UPI00260DB22F|nr:ATPase, T2SS/T4P/T4SS family [uncultured Tateyamaria sp.]